MLTNNNSKNLFSFKVEVKDAEVNKGNDTFRNGEQ